MSSKTRWLGSVGLLAAALIFAVWLAEPEEACAGDCEFGWTNANGWGMAATCAAAESACYDDAYDAAEDACAAINKGLCDTGSINYGGCYPHMGQIKVDCVLQYKCDGGPEYPFP